MTRRILLGALAAPLLGQAAAKTVFIVRHADRDHGPDPDEALNAAGQARAAELARVLGESGVSQAFVTELRRTAQTAQPLVGQGSVAVKKLPAADTAALAAALRALPDGSKALVVSHGGRVEALLESFGHKVKAIERDEYDRLYVLTLSGDKSVGLVQLRYGARSKH